MPLLPGTPAAHSGAIPAPDHAHKLFQFWVSAGLRRGLTQHTVVSRPRRVGMTEFVIIGLLPEVAHEFEVSIPTAGFAVSGYAMGVLLGAPVMMALATKIARNRMLMLLMVVFALGNLVSAAAPAFEVMLAGRLVASLTHGAFFGTGSVVAADLVGPQRKAGAIAFMFTGLTLANLVGVPLGTAIGQHAGWRVTFGLVALLGVGTVLGIARRVPHLPRPEAVLLRHEVAALANVHVIVAMLMTVLGLGGVFAAITYLAPMMTEVAGFTSAAVTWLLVLLGAGMVVGNLPGGRLADRSLMPTLFSTLGALVVALAAFTFTAHSKPLAAISLFAIGALGFATIPPLQKLVLDEAAHAPTLASAMNIGAFNFGNAVAAWLAGLSIDSGLGYTSANFLWSVVWPTIGGYSPSDPKRRDQRLLQAVRSF